MNDQSKQKRPGWVWAITIVFFFSGAWVLVSLYLIKTGAIPLEGPQKAYIENMTKLDYGATLLLGALNLLGAVSLFLRKRPPTTPSRAVNFPVTAARYRCPAAW